jgi:hypothetical protein
VLHLVPIASLVMTTGVDLTTVDHFNQQIAPMASSTWQCRFNLDGLFLHRSNAETRACEAYVQVFRNGVIESVNCSIVEPNPPRKYIPIKELEFDLVYHLGNYLKAQHDLGIEPPIVVLLSFLSVKDWVIPRGGETKPAIDRDVLLLPDAIVEDYGAAPPTILRQAFDALWQAGGWRGSFSYNERGEWTPQY